MSATITDEQFAARDLVRSWAAGTGAADTVRDIEDGQVDAWRSVYDGVAELGLFEVAVAEEAGGAGGSVIDLCAMVEEAARALIPGPGHWQRRTPTPSPTRTRSPTRSQSRTQKVHSRCHKQRVLRLV